MDSITSLPTDPKRIPVPGFGVFVRTSLASTKVAILPSMAFIYLFLRILIFIQKTCIYIL